jgi:hypothetical protein
LDKTKIHLIPVGVLEKKLEKIETGLVNVH